MKIDPISIEETKNALNEYDYALIYEFSSIVAGKISEIAINWEECKEAYIFNRNEQIHVFLCDGELKAVKFEEDAQDISVDREYSVANKFNRIGKNIVVRSYLEPDEDGQMHVRYQRLITREG